MMKQLFALLFSAFFFSATFGQTLSEGMSYHIKQEYPGNQFSYAISLPGADAWLENGKYHADGAMPACLEILGDKISKQSLLAFAEQLIVTGSKNQALPLKEYKGTLHYVEMSPFDSIYTKSYYTVKTREGFNFADLLTNVGGTAESMISIEFDRGCKNLASRPYLPLVSGNAGS